MAGQLARLDELDDYKVADGDPDVRGWDVVIADREKVGEVDSLIVDTGAMTVRYLDVKLDGKAVNLDRDRHVLIPVGSARLDDGRDEVVLETVTRVQLLMLPEYRHDALTRDDEVDLRGRLDEHYRAEGKDRDFYDHEHFDQARFFGKRRAGREGAAYLTRSEETLAVGKRRAQGGEAAVRNRVDTEHAR